MDIRDWLQKLGLEQYADSFVENDIDMDILQDLTSDDLREIGISSIGHRRKILSAASQDNDKDKAETPEAGPALERQKSIVSTGPERRHLTVLFSDLVGSTSLSTELDPEEMSELITDYQSVVTSAIKDVEGYVAQYLGDGVLAYFGYPVAHEREQERAINAGLAIVKAVSELKTPSGQRLEARVGIATGLVVVGDVLSSGTIDVHAVVGETPNLAARLQGLGAPGEVIIAPETKLLVEGRFDMESLGPVELKGIPVPIEVWRVLGRSETSHGPVSGRNLSPLVGRNAEMAALTASWNNAQKGQTQLVQVWGDPGIGKSRMTEQIIDLARETGGAVLRLYCSPFHTGSAYYPVVSLIERLAGFKPSDKAAVRLEKVDALLERAGLSVDANGALLALFLALPAEGRYPPLDLAPTALRGRTFDLLTKVLFGVEPSDALLVVLEDAHWMDPTTTEFWSHLLKVSEGQRVMFLMTYRPEHVPSEAIETLERTNVEIGRLSNAQGALLIEAVTHGKTLPKKVLERILEKADGNPLFIEELTKSVISSAALRDVGTHYELTGKLDEVSVPNTLQDSLMSRLDKLSSVKDLTQVASVVGRRFTRALIASIGIMSEETLDGAIDQLIEAELIFSGGNADTPTYTFKHALIRDAAYESMLKRRRTELHARIATILQSKGHEGVEADPVLIATHFTAASQPENAVPQWLAAGTRAMEASAMTEALDHLGLGLELASEIDNSTLQSQLEYGLRTSTGLCHISLQGWQAAPVGEHLSAAYDLGRNLGETETILPILYGLWIHWLNRADFQESQRWIDIAKRDFGSGESDDWNLVIHTMEVIQQRWGGSHAEMVKSAQEVLALYDQSKHGRFVFMFGNDPKVATLGFKSWTSWITGHAELAEEERIACREHSIKVNHPFDRAWQLMVGALAAYFDERRDAFAASVSEAVELGDRNSIPFVQFILGPVWTGLVHIMDGEWEAAAEIMPRGIETWEHMGGGVALPFWKSSLGHALVRAGRHDEGLALIETAIKTAERTGEYWFTPEAHRLHAHALMQGDDPDRVSAAEALKKAISLARAQGAVAWEQRAAADLTEITMPASSGSDR